MLFRSSQLGIANEAELLVHPKLGASWEGFVIEQALQYFKPDDQYFWSTQSDAELDLLMFIDGKRIGLECKFNDKPQVTASMRSAMKLLKLEYLYIAYTGTRRYMLDEKIEVLPVSAFANIRDVSKSIPDSGNFQGQAIKKWHDE